MTKPLEIVCIEAENSIEFLTNVFQAFEDKKLFAVQRKGLDIADYDGLSVTETFSANGEGGWGRLNFTPDDSSEPAQILFSSGTEGTPKAIVLSRGNISDVVHRLNAAMDVNDEIREYIGVPVSYSFGLGRVRAVSAAGGAFFLPARFDPVEIRRMLDAQEINAISAVPSLWRLVLANPEIIGAAGNAVRWIEIGSQYMSGAEKAELRRLFPNARIIQHYGLTEASRTTFLDISESPDSDLESVGFVTEPAQVRIGTASEICIKGDHVALGALSADGAINPLIDGEGWFHTSDKGEIRDGQLYFLGRLDDQINVAGVKLGAEKLERDIAKLINADGLFAISRLEDPLRGDSVLMAVSEALTDRISLVQTAAKIALEQNGINQSGCLKVFVVDELPTTGSGKIQRNKISDLYLTGREETGDASEAFHRSLSETEAKIATVWQSVIGQISIAADHSFYDTGGDSLSAMQIGLAMEGKFSRAAISATLEGRPLSDVASLEDQSGAANSSARHSTTQLPRKTIENWSINIVRGFMVLSVLVSHWAPGVFNRLGLEQEANRALGWFYQMGTEGFATIFGIGLGYQFLANYPDNASSFQRRIRWSLALVFAGLLLIAVTKLSLSLMEGKVLTGQLVGSAFYNILAYYVLALLTATLWFKYLSGSNRRIARALLVPPLAIVVYWALQNAFDERIDSLLEWPRLMSVAGYSYFRLSAIVFAGIALGYWLAQQTELRKSAIFLRDFGLLGAVLTVLLGYELLADGAFLGRGSVFFGSFLGVIFYFSTAVFLTGLMMLFIGGWHRLPAVPQFLGKLMITIGGLALPIYAFHGLVIPAKEILTISGLPGFAALVLPMGAFLVVMGYGFRKLWRMYFG